MIAALMNQALQSLYKWFSGLTVTYFTARSILVDSAFEWEKLLQSN